MSSMRSRQAARSRITVIIILVVIMLLAVLIGLFRIREVHIRGNERYEEEQIRSDLIYDFKTSNTLYFAWKYKNETAESRTPYLDWVQAKIASPGSVTITVKEKSPVGSVLYNDQYVFFDRDGLVLEIADEPNAQIPVISGVDLTEPELYQKLPVETAALRSAMLTISTLMLESELNPDIITFDSNQNITMQIGTVTVELGQDEYLEEKTANLASIYQKVSGMTGTLNMTAFTGKNETITFKEDETEPVTEVEETEAPATEESAGTPANQINSPAGVTFQCFDSNGVLHNDGRVVNGVVVDSYGNTISGCQLLEDGTVQDAYWNIIDTGIVMTSQSTSSSAEQEQLPTGVVMEGGETSAEQTPETQAQTQSETQAQETYGVSAFQAFDSNGVLHNDAHVVGGVVVDAYGNPLSGCTVLENGHVRDAYWNEIDPMTGTLAG
ncbi:MAG: cell division protein FtsQ/DivIB [Lachnospiraceae bacterium]|nr:cell division protein FtsQ/DivIB [Lachnospiraceae bacterium]